MGADHKTPAGPLPPGPLSPDALRHFRANVAAISGPLPLGPLKPDHAALSGLRQRDETPQRMPEVQEHIDALIELARGQPGVLTLASYGENPETKSPLPARHYNTVPDADGAATLAERAHEWAAESHRNVYMALTLAREDLAHDQKPGKRDVRAVLGLVADFDDPNAAEWPNRLPITPTMVYETSPNRFQAFFLFDRPVPPDDAGVLAEGLKIATGADSCTSDIAHVWRIPGLPNRPNAHKVKDGRATTPFLVRVVKARDGKPIAPDVLRRALPKPSPKASQVASDGRHREQPQPAGQKGQQGGAIPADLADLIENGVPQGKRSETFYAVVGRLRGLGYDTEQIFDRLLVYPDGIAEKYLERSQADLRQEITRAYNKVRDRPAPEVFGPASGAQVEDWVAEINSSHFFTLIGGTAVVCREEELADRSGRALRPMKLNDFKASLANTKTATGKSKGAAWLEHSARRQYLGGLVFNPEQPAPAGCYNTWRGWAINPASGRWLRLDDHIRAVICAGNDEHAEWLLSWCAHLFQRPWEKGEVAVVLRGGEGTGKGTFARALGQIAGTHYLHLFNPKHVVGQFNAHLADAVLLFADEAFFAGDKSSNGVLKGLITEHEIHIERKGIDAVRGRNRLHILMATNERWAVPAGNDARRYFVLDTGKSLKNDQAYFSALNREMEAGGLAAFFRDMLDRDITNFDHRRAPKTRGLLDQKLHSLTGVRRWWFDKLASSHEPMPDEAAPGHWRTEIAKTELYDEFNRWRRDQRGETYQAEAVQAFWKILREFCDVEDFRPGHGTHTRVRMVRLPDLKTARFQFDAWIGGDVEWDAAD